MRSKHDIPNKFDYLKAYSFNFILTERTNSELEHEKNVGKIDSAFYRNFSWQIMGKKKERQLSNIEPKDVAKATKIEAVSESVTKATNLTNVSNGRLGQDSTSLEQEITVQSRIDLSGSTPKRYTTTCYFKPRTTPSWYTESLLIFIGSTKRRYKEKVWFKNKIQPYYWSENMTTHVNMPPTKLNVSEVMINTEKSDAHFMSLEPQQLAVSAN